jgi:hypothetical protein
VSEALSPEALRHAALEALGPYADPRAREALQASGLRVEPAFAGWESSAGHVDGQLVTLAVDAATLGRLRAAPALEDALHAALAAAVARHPGQTLAALALRWGREGAQATPDGYRDRPPDAPQTLQQAVPAYLDARGEDSLARLVEGASLELDAKAGSLRVVLDTDRLRAFRSAGAAATSALTAAARDLLDTAGLRVVLSVEG